MSEQAGSRQQAVRWGLFGGAGFIGQHLAASILSRSPADKVTLLDIRSPLTSPGKAELEQYFSEGRLGYLNVDVRQPEQVLANPETYDVIVNLAAIHREPGHRADEYWETNVAGAENVCHFATERACDEMIFISSIAVYGIHDRAVDETTQVQPKTPYGCSKLEAERIHRRWATRSEGRLAIIRPGVVFGHGENGNVSRLVRESLRMERAIGLQPDQAKAGIYIEELLGLMHWLRRQTPAADGCQLVNGVSNEDLSFNAFGQALQQLRGFGKKPLTISASWLKSAVFLMKPLAMMLPATSKIHPERLAKLTRANDVRSIALLKQGYPFAWTLERALEDWLGKGL